MGNQMFFHKLLLNDFMCENLYNDDERILS